MSNYVSKENAIGLKEIGFDVPVIGYYRAKSDYSEGTELEFSSSPNNANEGSWFSAPDFLSAADWLFNEHRIYFNFHPGKTEVADIPGGNVTTIHTRADHRNSALSHAIQIIKNRKK